MFSIPLSPQTLENTAIYAIYSVFFIFSMFQCRWPTQTYIQEILPKLCFLQCFYNVSRQKHGHFQCFGIQKPLKHIAIYSTMSFHFSPFFHCRKLTKMTKIQFQYLLKLRHPKMVEKSCTIRSPGCRGPRFPSPWDLSNGCFFHFSSPWGLPKLGNSK